MSLQLVHHYANRLELSADGRQLFTYVYADETPQMESPRPYFHPMHTLAGDPVTIFRPYDHVWHRGLTMTIAHLEDQNFWGGGSYRHGQGYVQLANNGAQRHRGWESLTCSDERFDGRHQIVWTTEGGEDWIREDRSLAVPAPDRDAAFWQLDFSTSLTNVRSEPLHIGSPTTEGRPAAGYGGLFWRGPRSFLGGDVLAGDGLEGPEVMGQSTSWLAYRGRHDGSDNRSTLLFLDHPSNPRFPNKWFVRNTPFAAVSFAFMFDEIFVLEPAATLSLRYRVVVADGAWERDQLEEQARAWQRTD